MGDMDDETRCGLALKQHESKPACVHDLYEALDACRRALESGDMWLQQLALQISYAALRKARGL